MPSKTDEMEAMDEYEDYSPPFLTAETLQRGLAPGRLRERRPLAAIAAGSTTFRGKIQACGAPAIGYG